MKKSKVTTEQLLKAVERGFAETREHTDRSIEVLAKSTDKKLDDFAGMVQKGFEGVDKRFEEMDKRFDEVKSRFNFVDDRLGVVETGLLEIKKKMDNIVYRNEFEYLKERVEKLEALLVGTKKK